MFRPRHLATLRAALAHVRQRPQLVLRKTHASLFSTANSDREARKKRRRPREPAQSTPTAAATPEAGFKLSTDSDAARRELLGDGEGDEAGFSGKTKTVGQHAALIGGTLFLSLWVAATFAQGGGSEPDVLLRTFEETVELIFSEDEEEISKGLQVLVSGAWKNNTLRERLCEPRIVKRLFHMLSYTEADLVEVMSADGTTVEHMKPRFPPKVQNVVSEVLQVLTLHEPNHDRLLGPEINAHLHLMQVLNSDHAFIFVKKNTALALSRLASTASRQLDLGHAGAVSSLHRVLKNDLLFRRRIQTAVYNISAECEKELEASEAAAGRYTNSDRSLVSIYADKFREYKNRFGQFSALLGAENSLMESGSLLYLHTILGGAAWALATGLFKGLPVVFLRRSVYRTALVTGFVPAYFIGGVVTFYQAQLLTMDSYEEAFRLYFGCSVAVVLPWLYMLPILDAYCPLWLGGHIVGFCSFFLSCYLNDSDIFKTDHLLASYEEDQKREQARKEYEDKKKFFQL